MEAYLLRTRYLRAPYGEARLLVLPALSLWVPVQDVKKVLRHTVRPFLALLCLTLPCTCAYRSIFLVGTRTRHCPRTS